MVRDKTNQSWTSTEEGLQKEKAWLRLIYQIPLNGSISLVHLSKWN